MNFQFITFISTAILVSLAMITTVVKSLQHVFELSKTQSLYVWIVSITTLICFVAGNALVSKFSTDNIIARLIYNFGANVGGLYYYLFVSACIIGILLLLSNLIIIPHLYTINIGIFGIGFLLWCIGITSVYMPRAVTYTLKTPSSMPSLQGKTIAVVTDTHYGAQNRHAESKRLERFLNKQTFDALFVVGDVFDGPAIDPQTVLHGLQSPLSKNIPVIYAPGNHEEYGAYNEFIQAISSAGITVLQDSTTIIFNDVPVMGLTYRSKSQTEGIAPSFTNTGLSKEKESLVLSHAPHGYEAIAASGGRIIFSGHTHRGQFWPNEYIVKMIYGNYFYGHAMIKGTNSEAIITSGFGTAGPKLRTFNRPEVVLVRFE